MSLLDISVLLEADILAGRELLDRSISSFVSTDLMSRVLALSPSGSLLLTTLTNVQVINTAEVAGLGGVVFMEGKRPPEGVVDRARILCLPALSTRFSGAEAGRLLTERGVMGV